MKESIFVKNIPSILFSLFILLSSYSVYMVLFPALNYVRYVTPFICFVIFIFFYLRHSIKVRVLVEPFIVAFILLFLSFINGSNLVSTLLHVSNMLMIYYAVSVFILKEYDLMYSLYKAIFFLAVFFLVCYIVFDYLLPQAGLSYFFNYSTGLDGVSKKIVYTGHYNIYFRWATSTEIFGFKILRCSGFCWESGQYQIYLNYALMYLLFFDESRERCKTLRIIVISVAIISTASTMGYILALVLFSGAVLNMHSKIRYLLLITMAGVVALLIYQLIIEKQEVANVSYTARTSEFEYLSYILFNNGPLGKGLNTQIIVNGLLCFYWDFGYAAIGVSVLLIFYIFKSNPFFIHIRHKIFFIIWLLLSLFNEPIQYMNFTFAIVSIISLGVVLRKEVFLQKKITTLH